MTKAKKKSNKKATKTKGSKVKIRNVGQQTKKELKILPKSQINDISQIKGVGYKITAEILNTYGTTSLENLQKKPDKELLKIPGVGPSTIARIKNKKLSKPRKRSKKEIFDEQWDIKAGYFDPNLETFGSSAKYRGAKSWFAKITEKDPKFKFKREFLNTMEIDGTRSVDLDDVAIGDIVERGSNYYSGSGRKSTDRKYYIIQKKAGRKVGLKQLNETEVLESLKKKKKN